MKNNSNNESTNLTEKQFYLIYDYYTYKTLKETKFNETKIFFTDVKERLKNNFNKIFPKEMRIKDGFIVFPLVNAYMNLFNFLDVIIHKSYYTNDLIKTIFFRTLNVETKILSFEPKEFYFNFLKTIKSLLTINYNPKLFLTKSCIYGLSFFPFLYKFKFIEEMKPKDWIELFIISGLCTIPFSLITENYYYDKFILGEIKKSEVCFNHKGINRSLLISLKNIFEHFAMMSGFFLSFKYFSHNEDRVNNKTLSKLDNYELFKETIESNETFSRMKNLYIKDEYVTEIDYSFPLFYTVAVVTILYTPIEFVLRLMINMEKGSSFKSILDKVIKNSQSAQDSNFTETILNSFKNNLRVNLYRFFLQYGIITYYFFNYY